MLLDDDQSGIFSGVMCSLCDKTRRVDLSTLSLFKNDTWLSENVALREETLLNEAPDFCDHVGHWCDTLRTSDPETLYFADYERFCEEFGSESVDALHPLASLEFFIKAVSSLGLSISLEGFEYELQQRRSRCVGPAMHCCNLL